MLGAHAAPATTATVLAYALVGVGLGTASGLTPGLHANTFALLLAATAPALPGSRLGVGAAMLAAGVVHTFLDVVPALALGVPDAAMAATTLPGHRLVLAGRGREALRLSAVGSATGVAAAVPLAAPLSGVASALVPALDRWLPVVLGAVVCYLVATETGPRAAVGGVLSLAASAGLGSVVLDLEVGGPLPVNSVLAPLFAGLFGVPVLIEAARRSGGVPPQGDTEIRAGRHAGGVAACAGAVAGAVVAYVPGVSAGIAATLALPAVPGTDRTRGYVVASSAANTATAVFALFALAGLGTPRTGVMVALTDAKVPLVLPVFLPVTVLAAAAGTVLVVVAGDRYLRVAERVSGRLAAVLVVFGLGVLALLLGGPVGLAVLLVAAPVGLVPVRFRARRVHLMGVLLGPLAFG